MEKWRLILLTILALFAVDGRISYAFAEDEDTVGFVKSIEYGNFTVGLGIFNLSKLPAEVLNTLKELGLEKYVALVIVTPTSWATDSSDDHSWLIVDADGSKYRSLDPFLQDDLAKKVEELGDHIKSIIYRSRPRHTFAPNQANPLLVFFSAELPPIDSWKRVVFLDSLNGFQVDMRKISHGDLELQLEEGVELI